MSTYTDSQSELFWDPFSTQWEQLGFSGADEVYKNFGKLFPGYNPHEENMLYEQSGAQSSGELAAYNLMVSNETDRIAANTSNRQTMSELGLESLQRNQGAGEELSSLKKDSITRAAIESIDNAKTAAGQSGLTSGSAMSSMDMAIDTVKSKINSANASQAFSRKKTNQSIENLKANVGFLDANGDWVQGSEGRLEQLKSETSLGMANLKMENRKDIRRYDTDRKASDMYEAWQQDILQSVGTLFTKDMYGENATNCEELYGEGMWDPKTGTCSGVPTYEPPTCGESCGDLQGDAFDSCMDECLGVDSGDDEQGNSLEDTGADEDDNTGGGYGGYGDEFGEEHWDDQGDDGGYS